MTSSVREAAERAAPDLTLRFPLPELEDPDGQRRAFGYACQQVPGLAELAATVAEGVARAGAVLVRDACVASDEWIAVFSSVLGTLSSTGNGYPPRLVFDITPREQADGTVATGSRGYDEFALHSDSATHARPHSHFTLTCVMAEEGIGGESLIVRVGDVAAALVSTGQAAALPLLADPVYPYLADLGNGETVIRHGSILARGDGRYHVRFARKRAKGELAEGIQVHQLDQAHQDALRGFEEVLGSADLVREFRLRPGDVFLADNGAVLHGRRAFSPTGRRLLKRCKLHA